MTADKAVEAPIEIIYRAGNSIIPDIAVSVSAAAQLLHGAISAVDVQTALAGEPPGMRETLSLSDSVHEGLRRLTESLNNCADALVASAEDYRRIDDDAQRDFERMDARLTEGHTDAVEVTKIDNSEQEGATRVGKTDEDDPLDEPSKERVEPTPEGYDPADDEVRPRVEPAEVPGELS